MCHPQIKRHACGDSDCASIGTTIRDVTIIVAAGSGSRFGSDIPKQFLDLDGLPVVCHSIRIFTDTLPGGIVIVALPGNDFDHWKSLIVDACLEYGIECPICVRGGQSRWESVKSSLNAIPETASKGAIVLVHDGARPLVTPEVVKRVRAAARNTDGAIPAIPVTDSLRKLLTEGGPLSEPVNRAEYRSVQTPQGFALWRMREAYTLPYSDAFTDDASVLAEAGFENQVLVEGDSENMKITNPFDLEVAQLLLARRKQKPQTH